MGAPSPNTWPSSCWVLSDGRQGTEVQTRALANALGNRFNFTPLIKKVSLRYPWKVLPECLWFAPLKAYTSASDRLGPPWPDLLIGSGRCAAAVVAHVHDRADQIGASHTFTIQIQDPRLSASHYDLVIAPYHSGCQGENVILTHGSLHALDDSILGKARETWGPHLHPEKPKKIAVLIGGSNKYYHMNEEVCHRLLNDLRALIHQGFALLITISRRTPSFFVEKLRTLPENMTYIWDGTGKNPYLGFLAMADAILVTADSVSMITEACASRKPVYVIGLQSKTWGRTCRLDRFQRHMVHQGFVRRFEGSVSEIPTTYLNETADVVARVVHALETRQAGLLKGDG